MQEKPSLKKIVFLDRSGLPERFCLRPPKVNHEWTNYPSTPAELAIERSLGADVVITNKVKVTRQLLIACPSIKHIAVAATGFNIIDLDACRELGVSVSHIPSYAATTVAEHVIASTLCLRRELLSYRQSVIDGEWQKSSSFCLFGKPINDLKNSIFAVIGFGELGRASAEMAASLGMQVIFASRSKHQSSVAEQVSFETAITSADIISLHCNLTPETLNLIAEPEFLKMQPHSILINTARGGIVNEADLVKAVNEKLIGGVSFDVLAEEPPTNDSPLLAIADLDNVIITPHSAWASEQAMATLVTILADNVDAFLLGSEQNLVS
ncbi:MAG: glycerate dehydrogenase [Arenicella sp.]|jgi:glycerate dehydrogenase